MMDLANLDQPKLDSAVAENFLVRIDSLINWPAVDSGAAGGGHDPSASVPSVPLFALRLALLKEWYALSDTSLQAQLFDRLSFRAFVGFTGDGSANDLGILNELNYGAWAHGPSMASALIEVEQQLRRQGYAVRPGDVREPSLMPCTEGGSDAPEVGSTALFKPGELGRMVEAVTAKAYAEGRVPIGQAEQQIAAAMVPEPLSVAAGAAPDAMPRMRAVLEWPWGARTELRGHLNIGRDYGFSPLAAELTPYTHVSRKHAELLVYGESVWVRDLGSRNGTYVNDEEVPKGQAYLIDGNAVIRFGPVLAVSLKIYD